MLYRYYRLKNCQSHKSASATAYLRRLIREIDLSLKEHTFKVDDPILVSKFLTRFAEEADTLGMTDAQAYLELPTLLTENSSRRYKAIRNASHVPSGGVSAWTEAVNYLIRTYVTLLAI